MLSESQDSMEDFKEHSLSYLTFSSLAPLSYSLVTQPGDYYQLTLAWQCEQGAAQLAVASYHHVHLHHEQSREDKTGVIAAFSSLAGHLGHENSQQGT